MKISKIYLRIFSLLFACFLVCGSILRPVVTYASPYDLMINTDSNALMTLELDDSDYMLMSPRSSLGTVSNTIEDSELTIYIALKDASDQLVHASTKAYKQSDGRFHFRFTAPEGMRIWYWDVQMYQNQLPSPGTYMFGYDFSSDFAYDLGSQSLFWSKFYKNADYETGYINGYYQFASGDLFYSNLKLKITPVYVLSVSTATSNSNLKNIGGSFAINFTRIEDTTGSVTVGPAISESDYQYGISDSLSDLSSSVDSMTEDLSSAAENLEYISTSQNLIIQGIDNVVMHISDQLFAFWNQLYNLIHVPTMAKMDDIIDAINNVDLEIEVNLDGLKTTINNMSTAVQNKLQSTTDQITGGYDNSGLESDKSELDGVLNQYEQAEEDLFDDAKGNINDFEFDTPLEQFTGPLSDVSYFLSGLFEAMGPMNVIITFSLTLTIAMVMIGWYRFKGGR